MVDLRIEPHDGYLSVTLAGAISAGEVSAVLRRVIDEAAARGTRRILLNFLETQGNFSLTDRLNLAAQFVEDADLRRIQPKIAVAGRPPVIDGTAVMVIRHRGIHIQVFPTVHEALQWLGVEAPAEL